MSPQLFLAYRPAHAGSETWDGERESIRAAVSHLGAKEVAFELDVSGSALSDALNERDRKRWAAEWTHVVISMIVNRAAGDDIARDYLRSLVHARVGIAPYDVAEQRPATKEEIAEAALRELESFGEAGRVAAERARRGGRR